MNRQIPKLAVALITALAFVATPTQASALIQEPTQEADLRDLGSADCTQVPQLCAELQSKLPVGLEIVGNLRIGPYADVSPNGQGGSYECVYLASQNTSIIVERWLIWVEVGTTSGGQQNRIIGTNVPYVFVDTANGNAC